MESTRFVLRAADLTRTGGFLQIRDAGDYAHDLGQDVWQFAVELDPLRIAGLTHNDLRWLISHGYVNHAEELTRPGDRKRRFRRIRSLSFPARTCFVLSEAGSQFAKQLPDGRDFRSVHPDLPIAQGGILALPIRSRAMTANETDREPTRSTKLSHPVPVWDMKLHELRLGKRVIKRFTHPAPAQELILSAFQEENWPTAIDDPLTVQFLQDPKRRLHYTIRNLNRAQKPFRLRFFINGNGQTIRWELVRVKRAGDAQSARRRRANGAQATLDRRAGDGRSAAQRRPYS
jgi:hypothetical protein